MAGNTDSKPASEALAQHRVVTIDTSGGNVGKVRYPDTALERVYGSTMEPLTAAQIAAGRLNASIELPGTDRLLCVDGSGTAVVAGDLLMSGSDGKLVKHDEAAAKRVIGQALEAIAADGIIPVKLFASQPEYDALDAAVA